MMAVFIPDYSRGNPYQRLLADSLFKEGVEVNFGITPRVLPVLRSAKMYWKPNVMHVHWQHTLMLSTNRTKTIIKSVSLICELLILKLVGIKTVWTAHNIVDHENKRRPFELFFNRINTRLYDRIIVHTQSAKIKISKLYNINGSKIRCIPHGSYIGYYQNTITKTEARQRLKIDDKEMVFLFFGHIRAYKGIFGLIDTFKRLNSSEAKLFIIGKPYNENMKEGILNECINREDIKIVFGYVPDSDIQIYMNAADVMVLPYMDFLTPGSAILAISFGKPLIAPDIGSIPEILEEKGSFLYENSDKDGLLKAMRRALLTDRESLINMGKHNFKLTEGLRWDNIAKKTREIYKECLSE